jgi:predicted DNA binding protein
LGGDAAYVGADSGTSLISAFSDGLYAPGDDSSRSCARGGIRAYRMRCAIRHDGCWATNLGKVPSVYDLKFWAGVRLDRTRIMGTFIVKSREPIDVMKYNEYPVEYVEVFEERPGPRDYQYAVEYVVTDRQKDTTINLVFESGCVFDPPATVDGVFELHNLLAPKKDSFVKLKSLLQKHKRDFRVLSVQEIRTLDHDAPKVSWKKELTPRQLEAIQLAYNKGFYYYPRKVHIAELADEANLSRSTFQEHLRLAEVKLIRSLLNPKE